MTDSIYPQNNSWNQIDGCSTTHTQVERIIGAQHESKIQLNHLLRVSETASETHWTVRAIFKTQIGVLKHVFRELHMKNVQRSDCRDRSKIDRTQSKPT